MLINGHGVLWNPKKGKRAARFVDGKLETDDIEVIKLAALAGFCELPEQVEQPVEKPKRTRKAVNSEPRKNNGDT